MGQMMNVDTIPALSKVLQDPRSGIEWHEAAEALGAIGSKNVKPVESVRDRQGRRRAEKAAMALTLSTGPKIK
jgi:HEAT repeat protein